MSQFSGFHKKKRTERIDLLKDKLSEVSYQTLQRDDNLPESLAGQMAENHLGTFALPFSAVPDFPLNGQHYTLPLVTEEPSVVAALNYASKIVAKTGGFTSQIQNRLMIGQVALYDIPDLTVALRAIAEQETEILALANAAYPSIVKRGGGARKIRLDVKGDFLIVYLSVDVQEAMGANILNTMLEAIKPYLVQLSGGEPLMAILSNLATESLVSVSCTIPSSALPGGAETAHKISLASRLAQLDPYRASTHNKGIFNGVDALVLATGNDWRAMEAGAHAYASRDGQYRGLATWEFIDDQLIGKITLPLPMASVGGSIGLNPKVKVAFELLGQPDARTLAALAAAVGLAQNLAALRALVTTGIQAGHMKLQVKSLAMLAGAKDQEIEQVSKELASAKYKNLEEAKKILDRLRTSSPNESGAQSVNRY